MEQKGCVIFYSWQSDDKKSKNLIEKCKTTESDENILYDPRKVFRLSAKWR